MSGHTLTRDAFAPACLQALGGAIRKCPWFTTNNLNRDFVGTRGFSVVFRRERRERVVEQFPYFATYLETVLRDDRRGGGRRYFSWAELLWRVLAIDVLVCPCCITDYVSDSSTG